MHLLRPGHMRTEEQIRQYGGRPRDLRRDSLRRAPHHDDSDRDEPDYGGPERRLGIRHTERDVQQGSNVAHRLRGQGPRERRVGLLDIVVGQQMCVLGDPVTPQPGSQCDAGQQAQSKPYCDGSNASAGQQRAGGHQRQRRLCRQRPQDGDIDPFGAWRFLSFPSTLEIA